MQIVILDFSKLCRRNHFFKEDAYLIRFKEYVIQNDSASPFF